MLLKVERVCDGQHPSEVVVAVETVDGREEVILDRRAVSVDDKVEVGYPVGQNGHLLLVELPQETLRGKWRVWVEPTKLTNSTPLRD